MNRPLAAAAMMLAATTAFSPIMPAAAQESHDAHHPAQTAQGASPAPAPAPAAPQPAQPGMGGMPMMNKMGGTHMMDMMRMMGMMPAAEAMGAGMAGMATIDRVEGRIAFLRAELKITDVQAVAWSAFADALRDNARRLGEVRTAMRAAAGGQPQAATIVDRLSLQERWLAARLEGTRTMKAALTTLVAALSDDQKKTADELLTPHMGMGADMGGMMGGRMMQGQMPGMGGGMGPGMMQQMPRGQMPGMGGAPDGTKKP
jgi:hypothetical protein